jgi:hypothetical protein
MNSIVQIHLRVAKADRNGKALYAPDVHPGRIYKLALSIRKHNARGSEPLTTWALAPFRRPTASSFRPFAAVKTKYDIGIN